MLGRWRHGFFSMIPVGATNVGSIRVNFDSVSVRRALCRGRFELTLLAATVSADKLAAPTCRAWNVQRGDVCRRFRAPRWSAAPRRRRGRRLLARVDYRPRLPGARVPLRHSQRPEAQGRRGSRQRRLSITPTSPFDVATRNHPSDSPFSGLRLCSSRRHLCIVPPFLLLQRYPWSLDVFGMPRFTAWLARRERVRLRLPARIGLLAR